MFNEVADYEVSVHAPNGVMVFTSGTELGRKSEDRTSPNRWLASKRGDEDNAEPDLELAKSLGLPANPGKEKSGDRNALTAFARVGKFLWQKMTRIR